MPTPPDPAGRSDPDFSVPPEKGRVPDFQLPASRLAVLSLVMGIVGLVVPVLGSLVAIVSGHVAMREIRRSDGRLGGRSLAQVGLLLGYAWLGLIVAVGAGLALLLPTVVRVSDDLAVVGDFRREGPAWVYSAEPGVKLANEMTPEYVAWLRGAGLIGDDEPIVVAYEAPGNPSQGVEMAVVTPDRLHYVKGFNVTTLDLEDVVDVAAGPEFAARFDPGHDPPATGPFPIVVVGRNGLTMRVRIERDGELFASRLKEVWEEARRDGDGPDGLPGGRPAVEVGPVPD